MKVELTGASAGSRSASRPSKRLAFNVLLFAKRSIAGYGSIRISY